MPTVQPRPDVEIAERLYTTADLAALPSELPSGPVRYELDNGRLLTMTPPGYNHCAVELKIAAALYNQGEQRGHGKACSGEVGIVLWREPRPRVVGADAAFIASASLPIRRSPEGYLETIPDLIVEVLSPNDTRAYVDRKIADYLHAGVQQLWIADPTSKTLTVHCSHDASQKTAGGETILTEADTLRMEEIIPGFELGITDVFAE